MNSKPQAATPPARSRRRRWLWLTGAVIAIAAAATTALVVWQRNPPAVSLPLRPAGQAGAAPGAGDTSQLTLPGDSSRFDYAALDAGRGLLFIAHLGQSQVIEVDVHANRVVRVIDGINEVHGVIVVPARHRVYATATDANQMVILDEDTGARLGQAPTGDYPDGMAYDPIHNTVWTTNETGGTETVIDADSAKVRGTVTLGGEAGNVAYDPTTGQLLADVQTRNTLAVIDLTTFTISRQVPLPGCDHDHGLTLDPAHRLAFVACDGNATLLSIDLDTWKILDTQRVGADPDVLAYDPNAGRLYVAAENGWLTILDQHQRHITVTGHNHLADGAHVVAVDPTTHRSYYPVPHGRDGKPALLSFDPTP